MLSKALAFAVCAAMSAFACGPASAEDVPLKAVVDGAIRPVMKQYAIPGMAVGIVTTRGETVFDYGVASRQSGAKIDARTLFEIGSVSKTFTAILAAEAVRDGAMRLTDTVADHLPALKDTAFGGLSLLELGTHMTGGLPLQVPDGVTSEAALIDWLKGWTPPHPAGTYRSYSNISIGLFGAIAARSMKGDFATLERARVFRPLGLAHTFLSVPAGEQAHYAQGYTKTGTPARMTPGVLDVEAYGVRTTAADMARFVAAQLGLPGHGQGALQEAIRATHTGYFTSGPMTQDLVWEQYPWPASRNDLLAGNGAQFAYSANPAKPIEPPLKPGGTVILNKTGSTNGFGAYVAFVPSEKIGVVILANRNYPSDARVEAARAILTALASRQ